MTVMARTSSMGSRWIGARARTTRTLRRSGGNGFASVAGCFNCPNGSKTLLIANNLSSSRAWIPQLVFQPPPLQRGEFTAWDVILGPGSSQKIEQFCHGDEPAILAGKPAKEA